MQDIKGQKIREQVPLVTIGIQRANYNNDRQAGQTRTDRQLNLLRLLR